MKEMSFQLTEWKTDSELITPRERAVKGWENDKDCRFRHEVAKALGFKILYDFAIGDRVTVITNSERAPGYERIEKSGIVVGFKSTDYVIEFDDGVILGIYFMDLIPESEYKLREKLHE